MSYKYTYINKVLTTKFANRSGITTIKVCVSVVTLKIEDSRHWIQK